MVDNVRIEGLSDLLDTLNALPREVASKNGGPVRFALFKASQVVKEEISKNAPIKSGALKRAIYMYRMRDPREGSAEEYIIGVRKVKLTKKERRLLAQNIREIRAQGYSVQFSKTAGDPYYWKFLEFGFHQARGGGFVQMKFIRPGFEAKKGEAVEVFKTQLTARLEILIKRLSKG